MIYGVVATIISGCGVCTVVPCSVPNFDSFNSVRHY
jgi:hypothetical protein